MMMVEFQWDKNQSYLSIRFDQHRCEREKERNANGLVMDTHQRNKIVQRYDQQLKQMIKIE